MSTLKHTETNTVLQYIIRRAIEEDLSRLDSYEGKPIDRDIIDAMESMRSRLYKLADANAEAKMRGDIDKSNQILGEIQSNEVLRLLSVYHFDGGRV